MTNNKEYDPTMPMYHFFVTATGHDVFTISKAETIRFFEQYAMSEYFDSTRKWGFNKSCYVSDELADFLAGPANIQGACRGMTMSTNECSSIINAYISENSLRDPVDKMNILYQRDPALIRLFSKYIMKNFPSTRVDYWSLLYIYRDHLTELLTEPIGHDMPYKISNYLVDLFNSFDNVPRRFEYGDEMTPNEAISLFTTYGFRLPTAIF